MSFINGFFLVNFLPLGILIIIGIILFFSRKFKIGKWYYPLLFIFIVLGFISLIRFPVIIGRRYAMPTLVPGIVISVFVLMLVPEIFQRFKIKYAKATVRLFVFVILLVCVAKAMRFQEKKPYLRELTKALQKDYDKSNVNKAIVLIFGSTGGNLKFNPDIDVLKVQMPRVRDRLTDTQYQFARLEPEYLKMSYPRVYLICREPQSGNFALNWESKFHDKPELIYEYIRAKNKTALRLYQLKSNYPSAWLSQNELEKILKNNNVLKNGNFSLKRRFPVENITAKKLISYGVVPANDGGVYLPEGWTIDPGHGWKADCKPVSIKLPENAADALNIRSKSWVSLYTQNAFDGNKAYLVAINTCGGQKNGKLTLWAYVYNAKMKYIRTVCYRDINLKEKSGQQLIALRLDNCIKFRLSLLFSGNVSINNIQLVPVETASK